MKKSFKALSESHHLRVPYPVVEVGFLTYQKACTKVFAALRHGSEHRNNPQIFTSFNPMAFAGFNSASSRDRSRHAPTEEHRGIGVAFLVSSPHRQPW